MNEIIPKLNLVKVHNPFDRRNKDFEKINYFGQSILELRNNHFPLDIKVDISINGHLIQEKDYALTFPRANDCILFVPRIHGGGNTGKQVLGAVLMIVLTVVTYGIGTAVSFGGLGFGATNWFAAGYWSTAGLMAAGATYLAGGLLLGTLLAPKPGNVEMESPTFSWNPQTIQQQGVPIPKSYGRNKLFGNVIAGWREDISEQEGNAIINVLIGFGYGPYKNLYNFGINDVDEENLLKKPFIETRLGNIFQTPIHGFDDIVVENPTSVKITKVGGIYTYHTPSNNFDKGVVRIGFPTGLFSVDSKGGKNANSAVIRITAKRITDENGTPVSDQPIVPLATQFINKTVTIARWSLGYFWYHEDGQTWVEIEEGSTNRDDHYEGEAVYSHEFYNEYLTWRWVNANVSVPEEVDYQTITRNSQKPLTLSYPFQFQDKGQYEIKIERVSDDYQNDTHFSEFYFIGFNEIYFDDFEYPRMVLAGVKAIAQDQLSGSLKFSCLTDGAIVRIYDGENWTFNASANPAWICWDILTQPVLENSNYTSWNGPWTVVRYDGIDPQYLNLNDFKEWADYCDDLVPDGKGGLEKRIEFNGTIDKESTLWEAALEIMAVGRAIPCWKGTTLTVIVDKPWDKPKYLYSMGNIGIDSFKENFLPFAERANELEIEFINQENGFEKESFTVLNPQMKLKNNKVNISMNGISKQSEAWRHAMFRLKQNQLLLRTIEWKADIDSIASTVGDVVEFQHDVPQWGYGGRIVSSTETVVKLDQEVVLESGKEYSILITLSDNSSVERGIVVVPGTTTEITVSTPFQTIPEPYNVFAFGPVDFRTKPLRIIGIERETDQTAIISGIDYNETLYNVDTDINMVLPTINYSQLNTLPNITNLNVSERLKKLVGGSIITVLDVHFTRPIITGMVRKYIIWIREVFEGKPTQWRFVTETVDSEYTIETGIVDLNTYQIAVTIENYEGKKTKPQDVTFVQITPLGKTVKPQDVQNFIYSINKHGILFEWDEIEDIDRQGYEIRLGNDWDSAQYLHFTTDLSWVWPFRESGSYNVLIKSIDTSELYSENTTQLIVNIINPNVPNVSFELLGQDVILHWNEPNADFAIDYYEISSGTDVITELGTVKGTTYRQKVTWGGNRRFNIIAVDIAGNKSEKGSTDVLITIPSQIVSPTVQVIDNNVLLRWQKPLIGSLPIERYEIRKGAVFSSAQVIGNVEGTFSAIFETESGLYQYWVVPVDTAENYGAELGLSALVNQPPDYILKANWVSQYFHTDRSNTLTPYRKLNEIFGGTQLQHDLGGYGHYIAVNERIHLKYVSIHTYQNATINIDIYLNSNPGENLTLRTPNHTINVGVVSGVNKIELNLELPAGYHSIIRREAVSTLYGFNDPNMSVFGDGLSILYGVRDIGQTLPKNNYYFFNYEYSKLDNDHYALMPVNITETFEQHFTNNNWDTMQDSIDAGFPLWMQPTPNSAHYEEVFDYGTILEGTMVSVSYTRENLSGNPVIKTDISLSTDNVSYTTFNEVNQVFSSNFRYVKVKVYIDSSLNTDLVKISDLTVRLDVKQKTETLSGVIANNAGAGDRFYFNTLFIDVDAIVPSVPFFNDVNIDPASVVIDFVDMPYPEYFDVYMYDKNGNRINSGTKKVTFVIGGV